MINRKMFCKSGPGLKCDQETDRHTQKDRAATVAVGRTLYSAV